MKRKIIDILIEWKDKEESNKRRKPILLIGAKGVGKTYLAYDFAKSFYEHITYLSFTRDKSVIQRLLQTSSIAKEGEPWPDSRILILDEIPSSVEVIDSIIHLQKAGTYPNIIAISSNPISEETKSVFQLLPVYPMEFDEFLTATGNEWYIEVIMNHYTTNKKIPDIVHKELLELHKLYLQIGGMPAAINEYLNMSSLINIPEQHQNLISSYYEYMKQDSAESEALKMNQVFNSIPLQLLKNNKKFQYKLIRKGTTHAMYKDAIGTLSEKDYIIKCDKIACEEIPNANAFFQKERTHENTNTNFKLYLPDIGLLYTKIADELGKEDNQKIVAKQQKNQVKAIIENYVAQALQARGHRFGFWESESMAKIDFIIQKEGFLIPIEIHCSDNTRSKSISVFKQKCDIPYAIKISSRNFELIKQIKYIPYYAAFCL